MAKAGQHLLLQKNSLGKVQTRLTTHPLDKPHRPSVDILFKSAAETYGKKVLGVILTGMGDDGREGAAWIKAQGGLVLTESEESCVIYGMPKMVVESNLSDGSYPLSRMAEAITRHL